MRAVLACLVLCVVFAHAAPLNKVPGFEEGKRYLYKYNVRVATGVTEGGVRQFSGYGVKFQLAIENHGGELLFQLSEFERGEFNGKLERLFEELPIEYHGVDDEELGLSKRLRVPFAADVENGVIKSINFASEERLQEINLKKAIAALIQLNLYPSEDKDIDQHYYVVQEGGTRGDCETVYSIAHQPYIDALDVQVLNVTKTRLYDKCTYKPHLFNTPLSGYKCLHCQQEDFKPLKELSESDYRIKGNREKYTIENVVASGAVVFTPFTTNGQTILSVVNQTLSLSSVESKQEIVAPTNLLEKKDNLHFEFQADFVDADKINQEMAHVHIAVNELRAEARVKELETLLPNITRAFEEHEHESEIISQVVEILRTFSLDDFKSFFTANVNFENTASKDETLIRNVLLEVLPYIGSRPAIYFMFSLIEKEQVDVPISSSWFQKIPFHVKEPTGKLLADFQSVIEHKVVQKYTTLVNSGWLAYGSFLHKGCVKNLFNPHQNGKDNYIDDINCSVFIQTLIIKFNAAKTETEQAVFLRAIKNSHLPETTRFLYKVVRGGYPNLLRQEAIWALTVIPQIDKLELLSAMHDILSDHHEDYVMRTYAFSTILHFDPSPEFFNTILIKLSREPSSQKLASFAYNTLVAYANTTDPCMEKISHLSRQILQNLDIPAYDVLRDSVNKIFYSYNAQYNFGRRTQFISIPSNVSAFPRALYLRQSINVLGYNFDFVELGYNSEGNNVFEYTLLNALQPDSFSPGRSNDNEPARDYLKHVVEGLKLQDAIREEIKDYEVYVKVFNQDELYSRAFGFEEGSRFGGSKITYDKNDRIHINVHNIEYVDAQLVVPNEIGLPIYLTVNVPMTHYVTGTAKINLGLKNDNKQVFLTKRLQGIKGDFDISLASDLTLDTKMYVESIAGTFYGFQLKTHLGLKYPIKGSVDYDFISKKLEVKYLPSTESYDLLNYESSPSTFGRDVKSIHYADKSTNKIYSYGHRYFGASLTFNYTYDYYWTDYGSYRSFFKSFFSKPYRHEDYYYLIDKWYAGTRGFVDYAIINPTAKPFKMNVRFERDETHPVSEYSIVSKTETTNTHEVDQSWSKLKWVLDIVAKGEVERSWNIELHSATHYPLKDVTKTIFRFKRSPIPGLYDQPLEICYDGSLILEDYVNIYLQKPADVKLKYSGHIYTDTQCTLDSPHLVLSAVLEKSEEQRNVNSSSVPFYKLCKENTAKGYYFSEACWQVIKDLGHLTKLTLDVENVNFSNPNIIHPFSSFLRYYFYENLEITKADDAIEENHSRLVANVSYEHPVVDIHVYRPQETVHYHNIFIPAIYPNYEPYTIVEPILIRFARTFLNYNSPTCFMSSKYFHTFDGVLYEHEIGDCYYLLFADCLHHSINVLIRSLDHKLYPKAMRIFLGNIQVDIEPENDELIVKVNDEKKSLESRAIYQHISEDSGKVRFVISQYGKGIYISAKSYASEIYFDGIIAVVEVSNFYRGRQCGLCGNFDGEKRREFVGPDRTLYRNAADFGKSYAVVAHDCTAQ